jgi:hypothetical protein
MPLFRPARTRVHDFARSIAGARRRKHRSRGQGSPRLPDVIIFRRC